MLFMGFVASSDVPSANPAQQCPAPPWMLTPLTTIPKVTAPRTLTSPLTACSCVLEVCTAAQSRGTSPRELPWDLGEAGGPGCHIPSGSIDRLRQLCTNCINIHGELKEMWLSRLIIRACPEGCGCSPGAAGRAAVSGRDTARVPQAAHLQCDMGHGAAGASHRAGTRAASQG